MVLSSIDNAELTSKYLSPNQFIKSSTSDKAISQYLELISIKVQQEVDVHNAYLSNKDKFQIPTHAYGFEPGTLGVDSNDMWDSIAVITRLSVENNDYPVFRQSLNAILKMVLAFYSFKVAGEDTYQVNDGINMIARKRVRSIISNIEKLDKNGIFLQTLSSELCNFLMRDEVLMQPCSNITRAIASDTVWIGKKMLEKRSVVDPIRILNTIHRVIELGIYRLEKDDVKNDMIQVDKYNISFYAHDIKSLGVSALYSDSFHFAYRCMETLSYLGCNAAKLKSTQTIVAVLESIVQLGRVAKHLDISCFWTGCLIPAESHAEEFMGHILTWLVQDLNSRGDFYMKGHAEQAYSRLRGVKCVILPKPNTNPRFWIEELEEEGIKKHHIEYESGMWGYDGRLDYSDFSNLKEYVLHGIGSGSAAHIVHGPPMPIKLEDIDT